LTVATATGLVATVDVAHEASSRRIGPRTDGADLRVTTGVPLRLAILAGRDPDSLASARAAALGACADIVLTLTAGPHASFVDRASALRDARPQAALVVTDASDAAGVIDLVEALRAGCIGQPDPPALLVAADDRSRQRIAYSAVPLAVEAIPGRDTVHAREAIVARLRGMRREGGDVVLRDEAIESAARSLAASTSRSTLVVDVTGASTSLAFAAASGRLLSAHSHLGVGAGADRVVSQAGLDRVRRWIPWPIDAPALLERVFNRARWPDAVPSSPLTLAIEMSLARESIAQLLREAARAGVDIAAMRRASSIVCTGALARFPRASQSVLAALDAVAPEGTQLIARERPDELLAAGAIASRSSADVTATLEPLALVASIWPKRATAVSVTDERGSSVEHVARGSLLLMPTSGAVELKIGVEPALASAPALAVGVVVDARGRPLELPPRDAERLPALGRWQAALATLPVSGNAS
jgi:MutL protein